MINYTVKVEGEPDFRESDFTNYEFVKTLNLSEDDFKDNVNIDRRAMYGQFTDTERSFLYNFVRKIKPNKILEFSPCHGYTTMLIRTALFHEEIKPEYFTTYEIDREYYNNTVKNLKAFPDVNIIFGDVLQEMDLKRIAECDLLFVNSDHHKEFVERYVDKFFYLLKPGAWVGIHDIAFHPQNGETQVIVQFLKDRSIEKCFYLPDVMNKLGVKDESYNVLGNMNREQSTTMWFQV